MSNATTGGRMRGFFVRYILALTVLWVVILRVTDLLPKEGELIPRGGAWRPATEADCLQSFLSFTCGWYFGALARPSKPQVAKPKTTPTHADLIDGLGALGLVATPAQVGEAVAALYPAGVNDTDWGQVLRAVFLRLKASGHGR